jgi:hypothetical protein
MQAPETQKGQQAISPCPLESRVVPGWAQKLFISINVAFNAKTAAETTKKNCK